MPKTLASVIDSAIPTLFRRLPALRPKDEPILRETLETIGADLQELGVIRVEPLTADEIALIRDGYRASIPTKTEETLPLS